MGLHPVKVYWDTLLFFCQTVAYSLLGFSSANKCLLKVAAYAAQLEQYQKAIEIYEQVRSLLSVQFSGEVFLSLFSN